jgi:putative hydrolase of the HAD superfamily
MIRNLIFDLDNTLYPSSAAMDEGITRRMLSFVASYLNVPYEAAARMREENLHRYGTTLEWLQCEHHLPDPERFFAAVHPADEITELEKDPELRRLLEGLRFPKVILTNAPREHADRVLSFLGISDLFAGVIDIRANQLRGKPYEHAYRNALACINASVTDTLFLDDYKKYTDGFVKLGGMAVLVGPQNRQTGERCDASYRILDTLYELPGLLGLLNS